MLATKIKQSIIDFYQYPPIGDDDWRYTYQTAVVRTLEMQMLSPAALLDMANSENFGSATALLASTERVAEYLERGITGTGKSRHFKKGVIATLGYFINHESHHRGNIIITLKLSGHPVSREILYKIYDWDKI